MTGQPSSTRVPICPTCGRRGTVRLCQTENGKGYYLYCDACGHSTATVTDQSDISKLAEWRALSERSNA